MTGAVLDDMDSRAGSATSLLRTVVGLYLREAGGWLPSRGLLHLLEVLDVSATRARTALTRVRAKGLVCPESRDGVTGVVLNPAAEPMLARGDRRIFHPRTMATDDAWCLVSFSVPEAERERRHQLRRRLYWIGCGTVAPGLWVCPDFLREEVEEILTDLGLRERATLFVSRAPLTGVDLSEAVCQWWDLDELAGLHRRFLDLHGAGAGPGHPVDDSVAFATYVRSIDQWRVIPYLDPGLPFELLPADWPGRASTRLFERIREQLAQPAARFVKETAL